MKKIIFLTLPALVALLPLTLFLLLSTPFAAATGPCTVPGSHPTIQAAVNDVACSTINVSSGTFNENVVITRSLSIIGAGPTNTTVDGGNVGTVFTIDPGLTVMIESLEIMEGANVDGAGIYNDSSQLTISDTYLIENVATGDGGAIYNLDGQVTIYNSLIRDNDAASGGGVYSNNLLNISGSDLTGNDAVNFGGGIYNIDGSVHMTATDVMSSMAGMSGGGLYNFNGAVTLESSQFTANEASVVNGGGIYQAYLSATLEINNSSFDQNTAESGGGVYSSGGKAAIANSYFRLNEAAGDGGGLGSNGNSTVFNTQFISNTAIYGGGLFNAETITISQSFFSGNRAVNQTFSNGGGGGIFNIGVGLVETSRFEQNAGFFGGGAIATGGNLTVRQTTIDGNNAFAGTGNGGGISNGGSLIVEESAIVNNNATDGGGLANFGDFTMINSTVSGNAGNGGGGFQNRGPAAISFTTFVSNTAIAGGGILVTSGTLNLNSVIVALNPTGGDCGASGGVIVSQDYNLDSDNSCNLTQPNDLPSTTPLLGPLQNNGGWTPTHALLTGSPGIDQGDTGNCPATDQRGFPRPFGPACDIGAYEAGTLVYLPAVYKKP